MIEIYVYYPIMCGLAKSYFIFEFLDNCSMVRTRPD